MTFNLVDLKYFNLIIDVKIYIYIIILNNTHSINHLKLKLEI
jgi:hypothetical protein